MTICTLCRRNLLAGERFRRWSERGGRRGERAVCSLCEDEASRAGWVAAAPRRERESAVGLRGTVRLVA